MFFPGVSKVIPLVLLFGTVLVTARAPGLANPDFKVSKGLKIIGFTTVPAEMANKFKEKGNKLSLETYDNLLGPGDSMTIQSLQLKRSYKNVKHCYIAAKMDEFDKVAKPWIPRTNSAGGSLFDSTNHPDKVPANVPLIDKLITDLGVIHSNMTVRIARTNIEDGKEKTGFIQMSLSKGLLTDEKQKELGIYVQCSGNPVDLPFERVDISKWKNILGMPKEEKTWLQRLMEKLSGSGAGDGDC